MVWAIAIILMATIGMMLAPLYEPLFFISLVIFAITWLILFIATAKRINEY